MCSCARATLKARRTQSSRRLEAFESMSFSRFSVPGVSRGNRPVRGTTAEPDRNGDDLPFCDFLGGWRVKKAPYEIRGLCYAACEEGPACDSTFVVAIPIVNRVYMNKVPCSMPRTVDTSRHGSNSATWGFTRPAALARVRGPTFPMPSAIWGRPRRWLTFSHVNAMRRSRGRREGLGVCRRCRLSNSTASLVCQSLRRDGSGESGNGHSGRTRQLLQRVAATCSRAGHILQGRAHQGAARTLNRQRAHVLGGDLRVHSGSAI